MDKKVLRNDIILIGSIAIGLGVGLGGILLTRQKDNLSAYIYVQNNLIDTIALRDDQNYYYTFDGTHGELTAHVLNKSIAIVESSCPHKDCINMGYVSETNCPIVCAHNGVYIILKGNNNGNDIEV